MNLLKAKVCIPSSSGGHLTHMWLLKPIWSQSADRFWITFDKEDANSLLEGERVYHCHYPTNRNIPNLIKNTILAWRVLRRERPDLIISSGAAVAVPFFLVGKLLGAKCVFVEVFDRVDKPTLTGRILNGVAELFVVQWPEQLKVYKDAVNLGSIF